MVLKTQVSRLMGRTLLSGLMGTAYGLQARLSGAVLILVLIMALFAQPGFAARLGIMKTMTASAVSGEDLSDERRETARNMTERLYWGRQVASSNPSLTGREIHEIGRAVLKYSTEYGLPRCQPHSGRHKSGVERQGICRKPQRGARPHAGDAVLEKRAWHRRHALRHRQQHQGRRLHPVRVH